MAFVTMIVTQLTLVDLDFRLSLDSIPGMISGAGEGKGGGVGSGVGGGGKKGEGLDSPLLESCLREFRIIKGNDFMSPINLEDSLGSLSSIPGKAFSTRK